MQSGKITVKITECALEKAVAEIEKLYPAGEEDVSPDRRGKARALQSDLKQRLFRMYQELTGGDPFKVLRPACRTQKAGVFEFPCDGSQPIMAHATWYRDKGEVVVFEFVVRPAVGYVGRRRP